MVNDSFVVNVIQRGRKSKNAHVIHEAEISYVLRNMELTQNEKYVWLKIACLSAGNPSLCCTIKPQEIARELDFFKSDVLKALVRLQNKGFIRLGLDIPLRIFTDINYQLENGKTREEIISSINSVHCQLLLPRNGMVDVLLKSDYRYEMTLEEYKNNMIEA